MCSVRLSRSSASSPRLNRLTRLTVYLTGVILSGCFGGALESSFAGAAVAIDQPAPELIVTALDGQTLELAKLRGKVVLVNFWATWCAPCRKEMPVLDVFYKRYHGQGLELIGISVDFARDATKMRKAAGAVTYPTAMASELPVNGFGPPDGVPVTYVIDTEGVVRDKFIAVPNKLLQDVVVPAAVPRSGSRMACPTKPTKESGGRAAKPASGARCGRAAAMKVRSWVVSPTVAAS
jgi:cytochrome c biogenesis protein CcmG, thiol:disulfide interchange protein DsbE